MCGVGQDNHMCGEGQDSHMCGVGQDNHMWGVGQDNPMCGVSQDNHMCGFFFGKNRFNLAKRLKATQVHYSDTPAFLTEIGGGVGSKSCQKK